MHSKTFILSVVLTLALTTCVFSNFQVGGNWGMEYSTWSGSLVSDIDGDGDKEFIVTDATTIRVFPHDADDQNDVLLTLEIPENYLNNWFMFRSIPSVGNLDNDDNIEIVAVACNYSYNEDKYFSLVCPECGLRLQNARFRLNESVLIVWDGVNGGNPQAVFEIFSEPFLFIPFS